MAAKKLPAGGHTIINNGVVVQFWHKVTFRRVALIGGVTLATIVGGLYTSRYIGAGSPVTANNVIGDIKGNSGTIIQGSKGNNVIGR